METVKSNFSDFNVTRIIFCHEILSWGLNMFVFKDYHLLVTNRPKYSIGEKDSGGNVNSGNS